MVMDTVSDKGWAQLMLSIHCNTADYNATKDIQTLDGVLATANGTYWTTVRLNQESIWDKQYWLRVNKLVHQWQMQVVLT